MNWLYSLQNALSFSSVTNRLIQGNNWNWENTSVKLRHTQWVHKSPGFQELQSSGQTITMRTMDRMHISGNREARPDGIPISCMRNILQGLLTCIMFFHNFYELMVGYYS